jgi:hypothetical protein
MNPRALALTAGIWALQACTSFHGPAALAPEVGSPYHWPVVESLEPTLRWRPAGEAGATYDLIVYTVKESGSFWQGGAREEPDQAAYYRENLGTTQHRIEAPLDPGREYFWAVRSRNGGQASAWSRYTYYWILGISNSFWPHQYFRFRTPDVPPQRS